MDRRDILSRMGGLTDAAFAVATVIHTRGSTPREAGAKMVIRLDGTFFGTIGGGCGEAEVWQEARRALRDGQPRRVLVDLTESADQGGEKICGGKMDVLVDVWATENRPLLDRLLGGVADGTTLLLATVVSTGAKILLNDGGETVAASGAALPVPAGLVRDCVARQRSRLVQVQGEDVFLELLEKPPLLVIVGAGHVAQPLSKAAKLLGFRVAVLDDRAEWATRDRFPEADDVRCGGLQEVLLSYPLTAGTYVVLVTRGHKHDEECLRACLPYSLDYVGMIGSKRRVRAVFKDLEAEGWDALALDRVHSPIGVDIGAETPEEIAISILAEIIKVRRGGKAVSMSVRGRTSENGNARS